MTTAVRPIQNHPIMEWPQLTLTWLIPFNSQAIPFGGKETESTRANYFLACTTNIPMTSRRQFLRHAGKKIAELESTNFFPSCFYFLNFLHLRGEGKKYWLLSTLHWHKQSISELLPIFTKRYYMHLPWELDPERNLVIPSPFVKEGYRSSIMAEFLIQPPRKGGSKKNQLFDITFERLQISSGRIGFNGD